MHMTEWLAFGDAVVWILFTRACFALVAGVLMLREPRVCGGMNVTLHRMFAAYFFVMAANNFNRSLARAEQIVHTGEFIPAGALLLTEVPTLVVVTVLVARLGYEEYHYRTLAKMRDTQVLATKCRLKGTEGI